VSTSPEAGPNPGPVAGAFNLRDMGGYPVAGGVVAVGRVYRCDLLHRVDPISAAGWLAEHRVGTLIDLRTLGEREGDGFMAASEHLNSIHRGLLDEVWSWEAENKAANEWFLRDRTVEMYERFPDRIVTVLHDIADAPASVLFHCTAGKDRTGVIASALLGVLGAEPEVIVADYARSTEAMVGIIGWYKALAAQRDPSSVEHDPEKERQLIERAASRETMAGVVEHINERYGSFAGWARSVGLDDSVIRRLRAKLTE